MTQQHLLDVALAYFAAGLAVVPDDPTEKYPVGLTGWETIPITEQQIRDWWQQWPDRAIGVRDVEGLDFDNKGHPSADDLYSEWYSLVEELASGLAQRLLLERTPSGGYHSAWRCEIIEGSQKLATRPPTPQELATSPKARSVTLIETRGKGGQFMVAPSPGYTLLRGDWRALPTITPAERQILLDCARALSQHAQVIVTGTGQTNGTGPRPGDEYNVSGADEALALLEQAGWHIVRSFGSTIYLCRPGKNRGVSATFGHVAPGVLYVFSSNASPFDPERAYSPFAIYATLEHNGDFKAAAKALAARGYGTPIALSSTRPMPAPDDEPPHPAEAASEIDLEPEAPIVALSSFPELPEAASVDEAIGADACPWLDEYIAFSGRWSPRSYEGFHEACGLWVLSTIAARRVMLPLGGEKFTNLYIALCARTSLWAKSTAAKIAIETIRAAGLSTLLAPDDATPQAFIKRMAAQLPPDWADLPGVAQQAEQDRLMFAGQRGWFFEEFGEKLSAMMRDGNVMADYRGHFRRFDDCPASYSYSTIGRGMNTVERPYLALLANLTPADLAPFARRGSSLWGDGFFARYAFVTPPAGAERSKARFPDGWRTIPSALSGALAQWHERLGVPDVAIEPRLDDKGKAAGYTLHIEPVAPQRCTLGAGVVDAFYRYHDALTDLVDAGDNTDLDGSYTRFADKAMRIAMLLANFSNGGRIEMAHWARAQAIAERWRRSLHHLIDQLGQTEDSPERTQEMKVLRLLEHRGALPARDVARFANISTGEAQRILDQLVKAGELLIEPGKRTKRYRPARAAASVVSVVPSLVSYPAQSYDSSADSSSGGIAPVQEVSYKKEDYDRNDYTTVTTVPTEEPVPDGDWGTDDDRVALARECAGIGQFDTAVQVAAEIQNDAYRRDVQREIGRMRPDSPAAVADRIRTIPRPVESVNHRLARERQEAEAAAFAAQLGGDTDPDDIEPF